MNRLSLVLAAALLVFGCKNAPSENNSPTPGQTPPAGESKGPPVAEPTPTRAMTEDSGPGTTTMGTTGALGDASKDGGSDEGGGRMAKPGWCKDDKDCAKGEVCERCGNDATCTPGCHTDAQCGDNQKCQQVQCIRCPCPGQCETLGETPE